MTNPRNKYIRGKKKEQRIAREAREQGHIAIRSAASKSPIDVVIIDPIKREIQLIQAKSTVNKGFDYIEPSLKKRLEKENEHLPGTYTVSFLAL